MKSDQELRTTAKRLAFAGRSVVPAIRPLAVFAAAALIAAFAAFLVLAQLAGRPDGKAESAPAFLTKALGAPQSAAPLVRKPAAGVKVAVRKSGFRVEGAGSAVSLGSPATGGAWTRHAGGATRPASFGHETVLVDADRTEQFLTVTERQGDRVWRWPLRTTLDPRLSPAGVVGFVDPKTHRLSDLVIPAVEILDAEGEQITPAGLRWSLASKHSKHWLELRLDDADLPLPYVIDPAIVYRASSAGASNGAGTTSIAATVPAGVLDGDLMIAHVAVRGSTIAIGAPGGWSLERLSTVASGTSMRLATYSRRASSTDAGTNYTWSLTPAARASAGISVWAGVDTTIAINDAENAPGSNSATITLPAVAAATLRVGVGGIAANNTFPATCAAGATCPRRMAANNVNGISSGVYDGYAATGSSIVTTGTSTRRIGQSLSVTVDSTLPTASAITFPASLGNYNTTGWNAGCATNGLCGTASDPQSGINDVSVSIQRVSTGLYWDGTAFAAATETWNAATLTGGTNWAYTFPAASFPADGDYTVHVRSTDNSSNVESPGPTRTFKIDRVAPTSNALSLTGVAPAGSAYLDLPGNRVYYRGNVAGGGSFRIQNAVTDDAGGSGAGSSQTAALGGTVGGWTHTPSTVSTPVGGPYDSNTFDWPQNETASPTEVVTGRDLANNSLAAPTLTFTNDSSTPPAPAITFPAAAGYNTAGWNAGCAPVGLCGTSAADSGSGLATVEVSIRRVGTGLYWDGSAFASAVEVFNTPTGTSAWSYAFPAASFPADGDYAVSVKSTDRVDNNSTTSVTLTYDTTAAVRPTGLASAPVSPANDNNPEILGTAEAASTVRVYPTSDCSGAAAAIGTAAAFAAPGLTVAIPDDTTRSYYATATDSAGNVSLCSTDTVSYTEDSTAPASPSGLVTSPASPANENNPEVSGSAEAGSTVRVYTTADCSGAPETSGTTAAFATGLTAAVADDSSTTFKATATDAAGNTSACSNGVAYVEDSTAPAAPSGLATAPASPAGDNNPEVTGSAEAGSTVHLYTTADCSGAPETSGTAAAFAAPGFTRPVGDDSNTTWRATATDSAGNTSTCSTGVTYVEDSTAPAAPSGLTTAPASPASDNTPEVSGSAEAGSTVRVYTSSDCTGAPEATGSAAAFAAGLVASVVDDSTTTFKATATDEAGNTSACSSPVTYVEDSTAPAAPSGLVTSPASPANDNNPEVSGSGEAGTTVRLYTTTDCSGAPETSGTAAAFATGLTAAVADDSSTTFKATATDAAGNTSPCSDGVAYVEDSTAPVAPSGLTTAPASPAGDNSPEVSGTAEAGSTVRLYATADCSGAPEVTGFAFGFASGFTAAVADNSTTTFKATATDAAGNTSACSAGVTYVEDSSAPAAPTALSTTPGSPGNVNDPEISGSAEAGTTVRVYASADCSGAPEATGTAAAFATPGLTVSVPSDSSTTFTATASDAAGNASPCSAGVAYVEDSTAPAAPSSLATSPASPTNDNSPDVSGSAEAGSTVRLYTTTDCSGAPEATGSAAAFASGLAAAVADDSTTTFKATATDSAGNTSACSSGVSYLEDSTAPNATMDDPGALLSDTIGLTATTSDGGSGVATVVFERRTSGGGAWTATPALWDTTTVGDGPYDLRAIATDNAGNSTTSASVDNRVVDNVAPTVILVSPGTYVNAAAADPLTLTASSPDGDVDQVEFFACSNTSAGCSTGSWSSLGADTTPPYSASWPIPTDGNRALRAVVRDYAGHTGSDVVETLVDRTAPAGGSIDYADGYDADGSVALTTDDGGDSGSGLDLGSRAVQRDSATLAANACGSFPDSWSGVMPPDTTIASGNCYRYRLRIADNAGNVATYTSGNAVKVDTVAPTATLDDPGANLRATVNLTATTGDTGGSGIADTTFQYAPAATGSWTTTPAAWNTMLVADGMYDLRVVVVDNAGNQTTHSIANRRVDNTPPTATMDNPGAYLRGSVTLTSSSADVGGSGVASVSYERSPAGAGTWGAVAANWDTTATADGLYDLRAVATDNAGNVTSSAAVTNVRVDNTLPDVTMNSPGAIVGGTVNLTADATDAGSGVDTVVYEYSPGGAGTWAVTPASWNTTAIADGLYDLRATATDRAGNTRISAAVAGIRVDNTAPTVSFSTPVEGGFVNAASADPYTLAANAADTGSGVAGVEFFACSDTSVGCASGTWSSLGSDTTPAWEGSWPLPVDGGRALRAVATDNAGRTAEALVNVVVDRTVPDTTMLTTPANPSNDGTPDFSFSSTEAGSTFECRVDGGSWSACSIPHSPASLPDGTHTFEVRAVDAAGNRDVSPASWTWLLDTTLPIAVMTDPGASLRDVVTLTSSTSDPGGANASGIASITYEYSVAGAETWVATPDAWDTTAISDGLYDVRVVVADNAGNVTQSAAVEDRRVDNTPPATALDDPGANIRATVTLNGSATDAGSGVQEVVFEVSPAGFGTWTTIAVASAFPYQTPLDTTTLADGFYDFRTVARDVAGNQTEGAPVLARRVDNTPPVGVMNDPGALLRATVNLTSVSDDPGGSGVSSVAYEYAPTGSGAWQPASPAWNTVSVPDGVYDLRVVVTDVAGNVTQSTPVAGRRVDNTPPTTSDNAPSGYQRNDVTVSLGATDGSGSGISSTQFAVDGGSWQSGNSVTIPAPSDGSNDGIHTISYFSTDLAGNVESPRTAPVAIDATAPIAGGEDPGNYLTGTVTLTANPSDDGGTGIESVEFQRSPAGQGNWTTIGLDDTGPGPYTADWDTVASGDGAYDLRFVVTDVAQNTTIQDLPAKIVDNTAPTAAVGSPPAGSTVSGGVSIGATALDANPIANVAFYVDGNPVGSSSSPPFTIGWDSTGHGDGPASIHVTVTDIAGNSTTSSAISITVDNLAPAVSLSDPGSSVHGSVGLSASADGDTVQVVFERRPASGGGWSAIDTDTSAPWSAIFDTTLVPDGNYELRATATDAGANSSSSNVVTTRVDNTNPSGALSSPGDGQTVGGPSVQLAATASDSGSGVGSVTFEARPVSGGWGTIASVSSSPYETNWDTTALASGDYELRAVVADGAGNTFTTGTILVTVDSSAPGVTLDDPGSQISGNVTLSASTTGDASMVTFSFSPTGAGSWTQVGTADTSMPWSRNFATTGVPDGVYDLRAVVSDAVGNTSVSVRAGVRVDNTAPTLVSSVPAGGSIVTAVSSIELTFSEAIAALENVELDGAPAVAPIVSGSVATYNTGALGNGPHTLMGTVRDGAGKTGAFSVSFVVGVAPPTPPSGGQDDIGDFTSVTPIDAPSGFEAFVGADGTLTLRWRPVMFEEEQLTTILLIDGVAVRSFEPGVSSVNLGPFTADDTRTFALAAVGPDGTLGAQTPTVRALPMLVGLTLEEATALLEARGFEVGRVTGTGTVVRPIGVVLAPVGSAIPLELSPGEPPETRFVFDVASAKTFSWAKRTWVGTRISTTRAAQVTVSLLDSRGRRVHRWRLSVKAGAAVVKLRMPTKVRRAGKYKLVFAAQSGLVTAKRTRPLEIVGKKSKPVPPSRKPVEVVLAAGSNLREEIARGMGPGAVVTTAESDAAFSLTADTRRRVEVVVVDVDRFGVGLVRDLRIVFPNVRILALSDDRKRLAQAMKAGATVAVPRSTPAAQLAKLVKRLALQRG